MPTRIIYDNVWLVRLLSKVVLDVLPASVASLIGGYLVTQYQFGHAPAPQPNTEQAAPLSAEMMQLVRDEHARIVDFLDAQSAAAKRQVVDEQAPSAQAAPEPAAVPLPPASPRIAAAKPLPRRKPVAAVASAQPRHAPELLVVAAATQKETAAPADPTAAAAPAAPPAQETNPVLAKTLDIRDHVVATTRHVVNVIGEIPSWIGWRMGGAGAPANGGSFAASS